MDFLILMAYISLGISILIFLGDFIMQYWLVIRWGPGVTKRLVVDEFKNKQTAREVREALDLPDRAALQALQDKISVLQDLGTVPTAIKALEGRFEAVDKQIKELPAALALTDAQINGIGDAVGKSVRGMLGKAGQEASKEEQAFWERYRQNPQAVGQDQQILYQNMIKQGVPPNLAAQAVQEGPDAVGLVLRRILGNKTGRFVDDIRMAAPMLEQQLRRR